MVVVVVVTVGGRDGVKKKREAPRRYVENLRFPFDHFDHLARLGMGIWDWL